MSETDKAERALELWRRWFNEEKCIPYWWDGADTFCFFCQGNEGRHYSDCIYLEVCELLGLEPK